MMTDEEKRVVIAACKRYPAGVDQGCWGYGPMECRLQTGPVLGPHDCSKSLLLRYG